MFKFKKQKERNQIIDKAENMILEMGFTGIMEKDFLVAENTVEKQAFLIETLLYKYDYGDVAERSHILKELDRECMVLDRMLKEQPADKTPKEIYEDMVENASISPKTISMEVNGDEVKFKAFLCGEYFNGKEYRTVAASGIYLNDEALYEVLPIEGMWSCSSNFNDLKMISTGMFDTPEDAFGWINFVTEEKEVKNEI